MRISNCERERLKALEKAEAEARAEVEALLILEEKRREKIKQSAHNHYVNNREKINAKRAEKYREKTALLKSQKQGQVVVNRIGIEEVKEVMPVVEEVKEVIPVLEEINEIQPIVEEIKEIKIIPNQEVVEEVKEVVEEVEITPVIPDLPVQEIITNNNEITLNNDNITPINEELNIIDSVLTDEVIKDAIKEVIIQNLDNEISRNRQAKLDKIIKDELFNAPFGYEPKVEPINKITSNNLKIINNKRTLNKNDKAIVIYKKGRTLKKVNFNLCF